MSPGWTAVLPVVLSRVPGARGVAPLPEHGFGAMRVLLVPRAGGGPKPRFWVTGAREEHGGGGGAAEAVVSVLVLRAGSHGHRGRELWWCWRCGGEPWCVQAGRRQVLALRWMVLLVRQPWCHQRLVGLAQRGALCGARAEGLRQGQGLVLRRRGPGGSCPLAVSSLTVKGAGGRWPLGAGCWLFGSEPCGGLRVLRGAGNDGGGGEWGAAPGPPTSPPRLVLPGSGGPSVGVCGAGSWAVRWGHRGAWLCRGQAGEAEHGAGPCPGALACPGPDPALPHGTGASVAQGGCGSAGSGPGTALPRAGCKY